MAGFAVNDRTRIKDPEVERLVVEMPLRYRIGREVHLEAPVEQEPLPLVGPHAAADVVRCLEDGDLSSTFPQHLCAGEAGQTGPDDNSFHTRESVAHNSEDTVIALTHLETISGQFERGHVRLAAKGRSSLASFQRKRESTTCKRSLTRWLASSWPSSRTQKLQASCKHSEEAELHHEAGRVALLPDVGRCLLSTFAPRASA